MWSRDLRWRCIVLHYVYSTSIENVSVLLGVGKTSIKRWIALFERTGNVVNDAVRQRSARWPTEVYDYVHTFIVNSPCFYIEELQEELALRFPELTNISSATICRALRHDLKVSRKVLEKRARESVPEQLREFYQKLSRIYSYPEQLVFLDETSKDGRDCLRRHGWSRINTPALVRQPFQRGNRVSVFAAFDAKGFFSWKCTEGTFNRQKFHDAFLEIVAPKLNPWPLPRSIVILDNAQIHMYRELEQVIHRSGAKLMFLPPYSPQLNPIEQGFALLKQWLKKHADLTFRVCPEAVLKVAMPMCMKNLRHIGHNFYNSCGYGHTELNKEMFGVYL